MCEKITKNREYSIKFEWCWKNILLKKFWLMKPDFNHIHYIHIFSFFFCILILKILCWIFCYRLPFFHLEVSRGFIFSISNIDMWSNWLFAELTYLLLLFREKYSFPFSKFFVFIFRQFKKWRISYLFCPKMIILNLTHFCITIVFILSLILVNIFGILIRQTLFKKKLR